jgi:hypothetical protein
MEPVKQQLVRFFSEYLDDLLVITGILLLSAGGFLLNISAGFFILGAGCIVCGVLVGKAGAALDRKKRNRQG